MLYDEALLYIASLEGRGWRLGLDRMEEFLARLGNPHLDGAEFVHVAGTNGKGSVTAMIQSILTHEGYRTGSYFSPYVYDFRERIQVDGEMISKRSLASLVERLAPVSDCLARCSLGGPTEFEFKTALAFVHWMRQKCDFVALEVGLGGRLDATNVIDPLVSVITEIGLDHQEYLGNTIERIACEKAGIIKSGRPVVCAASNVTARRVIAKVAREQGSEIWRVGKEVVVDGTTVCTPARTVRGIRTGIAGSFQMVNAAAAIAAIDLGEIEVSNRGIKSGLLKVALPGRLEVVSRRPLIIFDGAHNPHAAKSVARAVRELYGGARIALVYSAASGHDAEGTVRAFGAESIHAAPMSHERALSGRRLAGVLPAKGVLHASVRDALQAAIAEAKRGDVVLVSGSFYLLAEAKGALCGVR